MDFSLPDILNTLLLLVILLVAYSVNRKTDKIMASQADLDGAIAALPGAMETALAPIIASIQAKAAGTPVDFSNEVAQLQAIPAAVAAAVTPA